MGNTIHTELTFHTTPERLYTTLMNSDEFTDATGAHAKIDACAGGAFSLFGGEIEGMTVELVPNERIVQAWRANNWNAGEFSIVRFVLKADGDQTLLVFDHIGFPEEYEEDLKGGWEEHYWSRLRGYLTN
ncbi:SRPBCC family protein [Guptibacillus hwajinpoensis]|uniref:Activator of HSP90 ATPase n=1 Tax=Guptibacillus hwajinpoensis TaxID=208199 RepID=A0ABU0K3N0_9BACL|nr:SRPBCC family protein [Alkalihalobacillus hemicentroti]MDQ0483899.1 activator of HSP90 ATPase [Alkalihalobacillus hemicentroti]